MTRLNEVTALLNMDEKKDLLLDTDTHNKDTQNKNTLSDERKRQQLNELNNEVLTM